MVDGDIGSVGEAASLAGMSMPTDISNVETPEPLEGEAIFVLRVGRDHSQLKTKAKGMGPQRAVLLAIETLVAEGRDALDCPYHRLTTRDRM